MKTGQRWIHVASSQGTPRAPGATGRQGRDKEWVLPQSLQKKPPWRHPDFRLWPPTLEENKSRLL